MMELNLQRNPFGKLTLTTQDSIVYEGVIPVHAFPISAPEFGISIMSQEGHELAWIENLEDLTEAARELILEEIRHREFIPEIRHIVRVSTFATPSIWDVETSRGKTSLVLKGEDDIRRLDRTSLLISDGNGIQFLIRDTKKLDKHSRRLLDRFL
jgi:hypothetical protein